MDTHRKPGDQPSYEAIVSIYTNPIHKVAREDARVFLIERLLAGDELSVINTLWSIEQHNDITAFYVSLALYRQMLIYRADEQVLNNLRNFAQRIVINSATDDRSELCQALEYVDTERACMMQALESINSGHINDALTIINTLSISELAANLREQLSTQLFADILIAASIKDATMVRDLLKYLQNLNPDLHTRAIGQINESWPGLLN